MAILFYWEAEHPWLLGAGRRRRQLQRLRARSSWPPAAANPVRPVVVHDVQVREDLLAPSKRPAWLWGDRLLREWGLPRDSPAGRQQLERALEARRGAEEGEEFKPIRRGWGLGKESFRQELLAHMSARLGAEHYSEERGLAAEARAEEIIAQELKRRRWQEADLKTRPKGEPVKVPLAVRLRAETTLTVGWIAVRLLMGTRGHLIHPLYRQRVRRELAIIKN